MKNILTKLKNFFVKAKFSFIMTIISFVLFMFLNYCSLVDGIIFSLAYALPFIIYLIITILTNKFHHKKDAKLISLIISIILLPLLFLYLIVVVFIESIIMAENPVTDIDKYKKIYSNQLENYFPNEIPTTAKNVKIYYHPALLQGGYKFQLYYVGTEEEVAQYISKGEKNAIWKGRIYGEYNSKEMPIITHFPNTPYEEKGLSNDFVIYIFEAKCDDSGYCNHGETLSISINDKTNELIFSFEEW